MVDASFWPGQVGGLGPLGGGEKQMRHGRGMGGGGGERVAIGSETIGPNSKCALEQKNRLSIGYVANPFSYLADTKR
jgi:hypothetical protein